MGNGDRPRRTRVFMYAWCRSGANSTAMDADKPNRRAAVNFQSATFQSQCSVIKATRTVKPGVVRMARSKRSYTLGRGTSSINSHGTPAVNYAQAKVKA